MYTEPLSQCGDFWDKNGLLMSLDYLKALHQRLWKAMKRQRLSHSLSNISSFWSQKTSVWGVQILPFITLITFLNKNAPLNSSCIDILQYQFKKELWNKPVTKINSFPFSLIKNIVILTSYNTNNICKHFLQQRKQKIKIKNGINIRSKVESMKCLQKAEGSETDFIYSGKCGKKPLTGILRYECNKHRKSLY